MTDTCRDCGAPVVNALTEGGRAIELDADPHPDGTVVLYDVDGHARARVLTGAQLPATQPARQRHSTTCRESPAARARRAKHAPRCRACNQLMDPQLAARERWTEHPACDSHEAAELVRYAATRHAREAS